MSEETTITVKFWAIVVVITAILGWLSLTVFANTGRIVRLEVGMEQMRETSVEIKDFVKEIRSDLKSHIYYTKNGDK